ncbi:PEP-CTERM sorting domain-containing protein [Emcibacter sp. SYSU 3D8]|uniref:PEP-CTERM sorting domain-containing protein n=1 Tax=Emcibacter sp. SYSU 3D8 TaxID=3133969 RepID=UPI0031FED246
MTIKANLLAAIIGIGALLAAAAPASALYDPTIPGLQFTGLTYSAPYGGPHRATVESDIESLISGDAYFVGRVNNNMVQEVAGSGSPYFANSLDGLCIDTGCTSGTWSFDPGPSNFLIAFVEISTAGISRLYEVVDYALLGSWNTNALSIEPEPIHRVSHMDFYAVLAETAGSVPEPGVIVLLGLGVAGIAGARWRRRTRP